MKYIYKQILI